MAMKVYYDLGCSPPTFDALSALCHIEQMRQETGSSESIEISFIPGPSGGFRRDSLWPYTVEERNKLLHNVAIPLCWLLPAVSMVSIATTRPSSGIGVGRKLYGLDRQVEACRKGIRPLRPRQQVRSHPGLITMTLREAEHWPERNSNISEWVKAAEALQRCGHRVVIVRDERYAHEPIAGLPTDAQAACQIKPRADLYASASLNLFVSNGPAWLSMAMDLPTIIFRPGDDKLGRAFGREHFRRCGIEWGGQMPGAPAYQRLVWSDDTADNIVEAVNVLMFTPKLAEAS
jgi:hypothetical protein